MTDRKIIIIDDNTVNGESLSEACRIEAPDWEYLWLQVTTLPPDYPPADFTDSNYRLIDNLKEAAAAISEACANDCHLIVFYDLQLKKLQTDTGAATDSPITDLLQELMKAKEKKMVVNVHSASLASPVIGKTIDGTSTRVITRHYLTQDTSVPALREIVKETVQLWENLYAEKSVSLREFIDAMQEMYHVQIEAFDRFIQTVAEEEQPKFRDPKELLMQFFGMGRMEFERNFCADSKKLKPNVIAAMKSISGVVDEVSGKYESRPLTWGGGWIIALGQFRSFPFRDLWKNVFTPGDLEEGDHSLIVHAYQTKEKRTVTLELFGQMCNVLFLRKGTPDQCVLEKVTLNEEKFSFLLDFPCVSPSKDRKESLLDRILSEATHAINMTYKTEEQLSVKEGHDTSRAIWRVFLSSHISDLSALISEEDNGLFGRFTRMNIVSVGGERTEVVWQKG